MSEESGPEARKHKRQERDVPAERREGKGNYMFCAAGELLSVPVARVDSLAVLRT